MRDVLTLIGLCFVVFTAILFPMLRAKHERADASHGLIGAVWIIVAFCVGSWLIAEVYVGGLSVAHYFGCWQSTVVVILALSLLGYWNRRSSRP